MGGCDSAEMRKPAFRSTANKPVSYAAEPAYVKQSRKSDMTIYDEEVRNYRPLSPYLVKPILGHA